MPENKYRKPKELVIQVYQGKELERLLQEAMERVLSKNGSRITPAKVKRILSSLPVDLLGYNAVLILEHYPLNSIRAQGKFGKLVFQYIHKTGTQYARKFVKSKNPRTPPQQANRMKMKAAQKAWGLLTPAQQEAWERKSQNTPKNGNNLFVSKYLRRNS